MHVSDSGCTMLAHNSILKNKMFDSKINACVRQWMYYLSPNESIWGGRKGGLETKAYKCSYK